MAAPPTSSESATSTSTSTSSTSTSTSLPKTMHGWKQSGWGAPASVLKFESGLPVPQLNPTDVLIRIHAASINPVDWKSLYGSNKLFVPMPLCPGMDVSGTIVAVGPKTSGRLKVGDEVWSMTGPWVQNGWAEYSAVPEGLVAVKPAALTFVEAATFPLAALTAQRGLLDYAKIGAGDRILVLGGSGGVGVFAIQLAKARGAFVAATASSRNQDLLKALGADLCIDYSKKNWWQLTDADFSASAGSSTQSGVTAASLSDSNKFTTVYDCVGGPNHWTDSHSVLRRDGLFLTIVRDDNPESSHERIVSGGDSWSAVTFFGTIFGRKLRRAFGGNFRYHWYVLLLDKSENYKKLDELKELVEKKNVQTVVEKIFPFDQCLKMIDASYQGRTRGKLALNVIDETQGKITKTLADGTLTLQSLSHSSTSSSSSS